LSYTTSRKVPIPIKWLGSHHLSTESCRGFESSAEIGELDIFHFSKGMIMASNNKGTQGGTPEQHAEAGRQSHKNDGNKQSGSGGSNSGSGSGSGMRGGSREQHAEAGRQSHKNDNKR
jgi:hypothetical protein